MKKNVILSTSEKGSMFSQAYECKEYENMSLVTVKNRYSALRKFVKHLKDENVIITHSQMTQKIFRERLKLYNELSFSTVLPVINKICRKAACKFGVSIPFEEIYIMGGTEQAFELISRLYGLSRLFTVISPQPCEMKMFDELYFKHGVLIRQLPTLVNNLTSDAIVIKCSETSLPQIGNLPVIDMCAIPQTGRRVMSVRNISISDEKILHIRKVWGGRSGATLYELLGESPGENAEIDLNTTADEIFLLDREKI